MCMGKVDGCISIIATTELSSQVFSFIKFLLLVLLMLIDFINSIHFTIHTSTTKASWCFRPDCIGQILPLIPIFSLHMLWCYTLKSIQAILILCNVKLLVKEWSHDILRVLLGIGVVSILDVLEPCSFSFRCFSFCHLHVYWIKALRYEWIWGSI